ncbi:glycosyltransferase [Pseudooceanicola algae]|uniref:Glycosyltransferase 2-like domain-containing protein n=1 Tax=Pseudooceanicola algae TaxID=1537215 RepID=A0A418SE60_9RHOB|nr:glycosyltransferase [Pseudooceanicola algae]QPM89645.1 hypothetical protein PSAL_008680 [Pseudooceanicola algae]
MSRANDTAVIIPARNEEDRIGACLAALAPQSTAGVTVILVVNNTTDRTGEIARTVANRFGLHLVVLDHTLPADQGVGTARKIGCDHALKRMANLRFLLTTDADCIIGRNWIVRNRSHLRKVDAVCGKVDVITEEADILRSMDQRLATLEGTYRELVQDIYARYAPGCTDIAGTHGEAAGASLGITKPAYVAVGGFAQIKCSEDRRIIRDLRSLGRKVRHASDVTVQASCRLDGRAAGGMSDALKARIGGMDYMVDNCLAEADWLISHTEQNALAQWPPHVPDEARPKVRDLPRHISKLKSFLYPQAEMEESCFQPSS